MYAPTTIAADFLQDPQFSFLKDWVIRQTGLSYYSDRNQDFVIALERVFAKTGPLPKADTLLARIQTNGADLDALVEQLTIGETFFFRHLEMFHALRDSVFPDLLLRKAPTRNLRIWSAGCSIGAEPYSIAILLREMLGVQFKDWSIQILGTDINRKFLRIAEAGAYDPWTLRGMPPHILHRCFTQEGNRWRLTEGCRQGVSFRNHNLATDPFPDVAHGLAGFDLVICRNVMIYFDQAFIQRLATQFYDTLSPGGWLAVGHAEPHTSTFRMFRTVNATGAVLYQRPPAGLPEISTSSIAPFPTSWQPPPVSMVMPQAPAATSPALAREKAIAPPFIEKPRASPPATDAGLDAILGFADIGDLKGALQACDKVILEAPLCAGAHYYHGMILYQFGEWIAAERSLRRSLYLSRDLALAHYYLGLVQERLGRSPQKHFENAASLLTSPQGDSLVPMGQGLTVREFRSLLAAPGHFAAFDAP